MLIRLAILQCDWLHKHMLIILVQYHNVNCFNQLHSKGCSRTQGAKDGEVGHRVAQRSTKLTQSSTVGLQVVQRGAVGVRRNRRC